MRTRLVFTKSTGIVSWLIGKISGGGVSHVGVQLPDPPKP